MLDPESRLPLEPKAIPGYYPSYHVLDQQKFWDAATRELILDRILTTTPIRFFTTEEAATMEIVVNRVLPQEDRSEATRIAILPGIDKRLFENLIEGYRYEDMPCDQEAYSLAVRAIEAMAQELHKQSFSELKTIQQEELLQSLHDNKPQARTASSRSAWRFAFPLSKRFGGSCGICTSSCAHR